MTIGHPDFLEHVAPAPPTFLQALGPFGAGGNWGPVNVLVPSGGSYHLAIFPTLSTEFCCTDVTISHLDSRGIPTWQDFFGGVLVGNALAGFSGNCNAAIVRGNIYGNTLQISGTAASSAFLNAVVPGHAFTAAGLSVNVYTTPFALADPQPHVAAAAADVNSFTSITPQSVLFAGNALAIPHASSSALLPVLAYAGPVTMELTQLGNIAAGNILATLTGYTVAGGSGNPIVTRRYQPLPNGATQLFQVQLAPMLHTFQITNNDPAVDSSTYLAMLAGKAA